MKYTATVIAAGNSGIALQADVFILQNLIRCLCRSTLFYAHPEHCNCVASFAISIRCCLSSVTRVYCDKKAEARIMQFYMCLSAATVARSNKLSLLP